MPLCGNVRYQALTGAVLFCLMASPAWAQGSTDPNPGNITVTGGIDFLNAYLFRGIPQDDTGVVMWPYGDLGIALHSGDGIFKSVGVNVGLWNSLHTGDAGLDGPSGKLWYESDFYATLRARFRRGNECGRDLHRVHEPERRVQHRSGSVVQVCARRQRRTRTSGDEAVSARRAGVGRAGRRRCGGGNVSRSSARRRDFPWRG